MAADDGWNQVPLPWFEKTAWSPEPVPGTEGIQLWTPDSVDLTASKRRVPVFGSLCFREETLLAMGVRDRHPLRAVVVGAIVGGIHQPYVGNAVLQSPLFPGGPGPTVVEYFAVDLTECTGLPAGAGDLFVFASVGTFTATPRKVVLNAT